MAAGSRTRNSPLTRKLSPDLSPNTLRLKLTRLEPLKKSGAVKGNRALVGSFEVDDSRGRAFSAVFALQEYHDDPGDYE